MVEVVGTSNVPLSAAWKTALEGDPPTGGQAFPVGAIYLSITRTNPATELGYGTWTQVAQGQFIVGQKASDSDFNTPEETGGAKTAQLTTNELPAHTHIQNAHNHTQDPHSHLTQRYPTATGSSSGFTIDTSMSGTLADNTLPTKAATPTNQAATAVNQNAGSGAAFSILPPYFVIYIWRRDT